MPSTWVYYRPLRTEKKVDFQLIIDGNKTCDFLAKSQPILIHNHPLVFNNCFHSFSGFLYCIGMRPTSVFYNKIFQYKNLSFQNFPSLLTNSILTTVISAVGLTIYDLYIVEIKEICLLIYSLRYVQKE